MLQNNVAELRQNTEGYYSKRKDAWEKVKVTREQQKVEIAKLEKSVAKKTAELEKLESELNADTQGQEELMYFYKQANRDTMSIMEHLEFEKRKKEGQYEKKIEETQR